jgi:hypothetical protein
MAQGSDFLWFFGVQQVSDLLVNIRHATFMQDRPSALLRQTPQPQNPATQPS